MERLRAMSPMLRRSLDARQQSTATEDTVVRALGHVDVLEECGWLDDILTELPDLKVAIDLLSA